MLTPLIFWCLAGIGIVLAVYSFIDNDNRILGHIFTGIVATVLFFLLGITMISGNVVESSPVAATLTTVNSTVQYTYTTVTTTVQDTAVGYLFVFFGVALLIVTFLHALELVGQLIEYREQRGIYRDEN